MKSRVSRYVAYCCKVRAMDRFGESVRKGTGLLNLRRQSRSPVPFRTDSWVRGTQGSPKVAVSLRGCQDAQPSLPQRLDASACVSTLTLSGCIPPPCPITRTEKACRWLIPLCPGTMNHPPGCPRLSLPRAHLLPSSSWYRASSAPVYWVSLS